MGSSGAVFATIDIAVRPEIEFRCGEEGKFIDRSGNSHVAEKGNSYPSNMSVQIIRAAADGDLETVKKLLEEGDDVNSRDNGRWSPLILAAQNGHLEVVKLLLENGADINAENAYTETALCLAKSDGHREIAAILEQLGAKP